MLAAALYCLLSGCGGEEHARVSYAPVVVEDPNNQVEVPDAQAGAPPGAAPIFSVPGTIKPKEVIEIAGRFRPKEPGNVMFVMVEMNANIVYKTGDFPTKTTCASAMAMPQKDKDGYWSYCVQIEAPEQAREFDIEVLHAGDLVATGKVIVE